VKTSKLVFLFLFLLIAPFGQAFAWSYPYYIVITPGALISSRPISTSGSYFAMPAYIPGTRFLLSPNDRGGYIDLGDYQPFVTSPNEPHPPTGAGYSITLASESNILASFNFFGNPTFVGTNPVSYQSGSVHPAPLLDIDLASCTAPPPPARPYCKITADLSSWEVFWNGSAFEQGPRPNNTGPFELAKGVMYVGGQIVLDWTSQINGGPFNGAIAVWHIEGQMAISPPLSTP
jgi:hypothetical protein